MGIKERSAVSVSLQGLVFIPLKDLGSITPPASLVFPKESTVLVPDDFSEGTTTPMRLQTSKAAYTYYFTLPTGLKMLKVVSGLEQDSFSDRIKVKIPERPSKSSKKN